MADPFLGELRTFSFGFAPRGWAKCDGQVLPINQNQALFSLLGTAYGGDGRTTFALPDLRARVPIHEGSGHVLGEAGGETQHTLTSHEMPLHMHLAIGNATVATTPTPSSTVRLAGSEPGNLYGPSNAAPPMNWGAIGMAGEGQPHENRQPFLAVNVCIATVGVFPSRN